MEFDVPAHIVLRQGSVQSLELQGPSATLADIESEVRNGVLVIANKKKVRWVIFPSAAAPIDIRVTAREIEGITLASSGTLTAPAPLQVRDARLLVSGSGAMLAEVTSAGQVDAEIAGSGIIDLKGKFRHIGGHVRGSGTMTLAADIADSANFDISGSGEIDAAGKAHHVTSSISGSGKIWAPALEADEADVHVSGSGDVALDVKSNLDVAISGSGNVLYKGSPHVNSSSSGSGKVKTL
jgi:hypothetical protein